MGAIFTYKENASAGTFSIDYLQNRKWDVLERDN